MSKKLESSQNKRIKIGIIGSGISGASCAYFLSTLFFGDVDIDIFEKTDRVGGRLATFTYNDREYETGGSILHPSNLYMDEFRKICGFEKLIESKQKDYFLGLFDSKSLVFSNSSVNFDYFGIFEKLNFVKSFGFVEVVRFLRWIRNLTKDFEKIYSLQDDGYTFHSIDDFLKSLSENLYKASKISTKELLEKEKFSTRTINVLGNVSTLANYGQDINVNGFVGLVSLAAISAELWSIKGGNKQIPIKLIEKSKANLILNTTVKSVSQCNDDPNKNLIVYDTNGHEHKETYDYVIIAFPLTKHINEKEFRLGFNYKDHLSHELKFNQATLVDGSVQLFPTLPTNKRIELFSCDPDVDCRIICTQQPCDFSFNNENDQTLFQKTTNIYKTFSPYHLKDSVLSKVFKPGYKLLTQCNWLGFPKYETSQQQTYPSIYIDSKERSRVLYLNSIEWAASCMELCCISARNVALIISNKENGSNKTKLKNRKFANEFYFKNMKYILIWLILIILTVIFIISSFTESV